MVNGLKSYIETQLLSYKKKHILILCPENYRRYYEKLASENNVFFAFQDSINGYGVKFSFCNWPFKNKIFDIVIMQNEVSAISDLNKLLQEVYLKLVDGGRLIMIECRSSDSVTIKDKACKNVASIVRRLLSKGFKKEDHRFFYKNYEIKSIFIQPIFFYTKNRFILNYCKEIIPLSPYKLRELQKMQQLKASPAYASFRKVEVSDKE